jgi:hypothetical protein
VSGWAGYKLKRKAILVREPLFVFGTPSKIHRRNLHLLSGRQLLLSPKRTSFTATNQKRCDKGQRRKRRLDPKGFRKSHVGCFCRTLLFAKTQLGIVWSKSAAGKEEPMTATDKGPIISLVVDPR